jgi:hypothetical protein
LAEDKTRSAAIKFVAERRARRKEGVQDQKRYWVDVWYRSSSDIVLAMMKGGQVFEESFYVVGG